jgi:hypothetical protein
MLEIQAALILDSINRPSKNNRTARRPREIARPSFFARAPAACSATLPAKFRAPSHNALKSRIRFQIELRITFPKLG